MPRMLSFVLFCLFGSLFAEPLVAAEAPKPNIIFIMADDLGYGDLGCYGQEKIKTPHLDQMAAEGMKFLQFYAGSTVCAPSRCVLMTGLHTGHCRVRGNSPTAAQALKDENVTVAEVLKDVGYETAMIGKWGLGELEVGEEGLPHRQGFDHFFGYLSQYHAHNYYPEFLWRNTEKYPLRNEVVVMREGISGNAGYATKRVDYSHDLFMEDALEFVAAERESPFFLYLPLTIPHANNEGSRGTGDGQDVPDYGIYEDKDWTNPNKGQAAMITRMDAGIGELFALLREKGIDENTIVFFTSDNGHHREGGNDPEFFDANGPLRGMKRDLYEGGIRVPFIVRWPGKIKAGSYSAHIGYFGDMLATFAELSGGEAPEGLDSISIVPTLLENDERPQEQHPYLYWEFYEQGSKQAVRKEQWKAIRMPMFTGEIQLYDLTSDIHEEVNVADDFPDIVADMAKLMDEAHTPSSLWQVKGKPKKRN